MTGWKCYFIGDFEAIYQNAISMDKFCKKICSFFLKKNYLTRAYAYAYKRFQGIGDQKNR